MIEKLETPKAAKNSLDRMTELGRKVFAVKKAAMPKAKPKKRKKH
jgi:hypothetical protein